MRLTLEAQSYGQSAQYGVASYAARRRSTSSSLFFFYFTLEQLYKVWRRSLMSIVFRILRTTAIKNSLFFHFTVNNDRAYLIYLYHSVYLSHILCYFTRVTCMLFPCRVVRISWRRHCTTLLSSSWPPLHYQQRATV